MAINKYFTVIGKQKHATYRLIYHLRLSKANDDDFVTLPQFFFEREMVVGDYLRIETAVLTRKAERALVPAGMDLLPGEGKER